MNTELARDLQYRITKGALAMLVIHGSAAETKDYERAIILIGSAWGLDPQNAVSHLELITREKEAARGTAEPEETRHGVGERLREHGRPAGERAAHERQRHGDAGQRLRPV